MRASSIMTANPVRLDVNATLDDALILMDEGGVRHLPVLEDGRLVGVLSDRDLLEATGWLHPREREALEVPETGIRDLMHTPRTVGPDDGIERVADLLVQRRVGFLPVVAEGALLGVVSEFDLLAAFCEALGAARIPDSADPPVAAYMTEGPRIVGPRANADEVFEALHDGHVRHMPVVEEGLLVGIVSDRDVRAARGRGELELTPIADLMTAEPLTITPRTALSEAAGLLVQARVSALPVLSEEGGRLLGILTVHDALGPCAELLEAHVS